MSRFFVPAAAVAISLAALAAVPAATAADKKDHDERSTSKVIEEGTDYWRTPAGGTTFTFPAGDVESLCHAAPDPSWDHKVSMQGVPKSKDLDWDSAVSRLTDAKFNKAGIAYTKVRFKSLDLASSAPSVTPCGSLDWTARLAKGKQPITKMKITKTSPQGGLFFADLALRAELRASKAGAYVGSLFYDVKLPDPAGGAGTAWSFGANHVFRAGMDTANNCIAVLRQELGKFLPGSQHYYFISNLIAKGECREQAKP